MARQFTIIGLVIAATTVGAATNAQTLDCTNSTAATGTVAPAAVDTSITRMDKDSPPAGSSAVEPTKSAIFPPLTEEERRLLVPRNTRVTSENCAGPKPSQQQSLESIDEKRMGVVTPGASGRAASAFGSSRSSSLFSRSGVTPVHTDLWNSFYPGNRRYVQVGRAASFGHTGTDLNVQSFSGLRR